MPAAIAESVKLLGIAQVEISLLAHPAAQTAFQGAVAERIEWAKGQGVAVPGVMDHQHARGFLGDRHDRRRQADAHDVLGRRGTHNSPGDSGNSTHSPSSTMTPRPIISAAATMRPSRRSALSARRTISGLG